MPIKNKPRQLRRCSGCQKVGHNKSRCRAILPSPPVSAAAPALKLFVHHTNHTATPSPHVIDVSKHHRHQWNKTESAAPNASASPLYHYYHALPSETPEHQVEPIAPPPTTRSFLSTNDFSSLYAPPITERISEKLQTILSVVVTPLTRIKKTTAEFFTKEINISVIIYHIVEVNILSYSGS